MWSCRNNTHFSKFKQYEWRNVIQGNSKCWILETGRLQFSFTKMCGFPQSQSLWRVRAKILLWFLRGKMAHDRFVKTKRDR